MIAIRIIIAAIWGGVSSVLFVASLIFTISIVIDIIGLIRNKNKRKDIIILTFQHLVYIIFCSLVLYLGNYLLYDIFSFVSTRTEGIVFLIFAVIFFMGAIREIPNEIRKIWKQTNIINKNIKLKKCPSCNAFQDESVIHCPNCGYRFLNAQNIVEIYSEFGDVIVQTAKEINQFDDSIRKLMLRWLVSLPWTYFETLFINDNSWNESLLASFVNSQVTNGEECVLITQAFFLWHLEQLTKNNDNYKKYSINEIERSINEKTNKGILLIDRLGKFRKNLQDLLPDDWYFEYINEILKAIYTDNKETSNIMRALRFDSKLRLSLSIYSVQMICTAKNIDT